MFSGHLGSSSLGVFSFSGLYTPPSSSLVTPLRRTFDAAACAPVNISMTPDELIDYAWDWTNLLDADETVISSLFTSTGIGLPDNYIQIGNKKTTFWLNQGSAIVGNSYLVTDKVMTSGGRTIDRSATVYLNATNLSGICVPCSC